MSKNSDKISMAVKILCSGGVGSIRNILLWEIESRSYPLRMRSSPVKIAIEPTTKCNLRCKTCLQTTWKSQYRGDMSFENFKKIINQFKYLEVLTVSGLGESLINSEIYKMLCYAKHEKGVKRLRFITNATLIDESSAKNLIETVDDISISLDGATAATYEKIRLGAKFDVVIKNIKTLIRLRGDRNKPTINIGPTISDDNYHEVLDLVRLAKSLGVDSISLADLNEDFPLKNELKHDSPQELFTKARKLAEEIGITLTFFSQRGNSCGAVWQLPYITWDGYMVPCCFKPDPRIFNFGNVLEEPFKDIWNNDKIKKFRDELKTPGKKPAICAGCPRLIDKT